MCESTFVVKYSSFYFTILKSNVRGVQLTKFGIVFSRVGKGKGVVKIIWSCPIAIFSASMHIRNADSEVFRRNMQYTFNNAHLES